MIKLPCVIRDADIDDLPFIMDSIAKSLRNSPVYKPCSNDVFYDGFRNVIEPIIMRCPMKVAVNPEDDGQIFGYISWDEDCLSGAARGINYIYIKQVYRGLGVGTALLEHVVDRGEYFVYKFFTPAGDKFFRNYSSKAFYNPFIDGRGE